MNKHPKTHAWTINKDAKMQTNKEPNKMAQSKQSMLSHKGKG